MSGNAEAGGIVSAKNLSKRFGSLEAVKSISFEVPEGASFGFLGPNGAGKTTLMRMICCLSRPTSGTLSVLGMRPDEDQKKIKARIGVVPQKSSLDEDLTVFENMLLYAKYHEIPDAEARRRTAELLEFVSLADRAKAGIYQLSGGMQRRLLIARALINKPKIIILDEPTTGLDPQVRHHIWQRMRELKRSGITFLVTTHYMEEAENLCDEIVVMNSGEIIEQGSPRTLIDKHIGRFTLEVAADANGTEELVNRVFAGADCRVERFGDKIYINSTTSEPLTSRLEALSSLNPIMRPATLEDVFLKLTGRDLAAGA